MALTNVKVLSLKAVMTTGMGVPACITCTELMQGKSIQGISTSTETLKTLQNIQRRAAALMLHFSSKLALLPK